MDIDFQTTTHVTRFVFSRTKGGVTCVLLLPSSGEGVRLCLPVCLCEIDSRTDVTFGKHVGTPAMGRGGESRVEHSGRQNVGEYS